MRGGKIILLVVLISLVMYSGSSYGATWSASKRLTFTAGSSAWPDIAVNGQSIYVVWHDDTSGGCEICFKKSTDGGTTWPAVKRLTYSVRDAIIPSLAVSGLSVYVVWAECDYSAHTDDVYFRKSVDGGATWQATMRLSYSTDLNYPDMTPAIAVSGSNVYVVWYDEPAGNQEIYFKKSSNGGVVWQATQRLTFNLDWSWEPAVAVDGSIIHVVWDSDGLYYKKSHDAGTTWMTSRMLASVGASPCLAVDSSGGIHLACYGWPAGEESEIYYLKSPNAGTTWTQPKRITWTAGPTHYPDIAVDTSGNVFPVWSDNTPGNEEIYCRRSPDAGATWQTTERLTFNGGSSIGPSIAATSSAVFVVWMDNTPGNNEIYFKRSIGGSI